MAGTSVMFLLTAIALLAQPSLQQQKDPLKDFCRRFGHQTAVIDNKLFIDGGLVNYNPIEQNPLNYTNTGLLYADLDVNNQGMPQEYANLTKPAQVPSVSGGVLWPDTINKKFYMYGGEWYQQSPQNFALWSYDAIYDNWTTITPDGSQFGLQRASFGASTVSQERGLGYWYGGWLSNSSVAAWPGQSIALSNMLQYDMVKNVWTNSSGPDTIGRAEGVMMNIPAGDGGLLIYFGGVQTPYGNSTWIGQPLDTIFIYDIGNGKWYTQKATGDVPEMRRRFCGGVTWAADQSSYNIYIYGGASMPPLTVGFDDVYILSLPSFNWIKWYPTEAGTAYPHHSLSCNVIGTDQMLVMGGTFPNSTACDVPTLFAFHNMDMGKQNSDNAKWAQFNNTKNTYKVPSELTAVINGNGDGGATKKTPDGGFSNPDLNIQFTRVYKVETTRTPTRAIPKSTGKAGSGSGSRKGAIIGGAVGGAIALLILALVLAFCCLKRRRANRTAAQQMQQQHQVHQHAPSQYGPSPHQSYQGVYPQQAPVQLPTNEYHAPVELASTEAKPFGSQPDKNPVYGYHHASHHSSPSQSPPPANMGGYFPAPGGQSPAPAYSVSPQSHSYGQQRDVYYPAPSPPGQYQQTPSPHGQFQPSPQGQYQHYSPHSHTSSPGGQGFVPSPVSGTPGELPHTKR